MIDPTSPEVIVFNLNARLVTVTLAAWEAVVLASVFTRVTMIAAPFSITEGVAWLLLASGPVALAMFVLRSAHSATIAQVLYDTEQIPATVTVRSGRNP